MNKLKLHAKLIDLGVVDSETDLVVIKEAGTGDFKSVYVTVVSGLGDVIVYIFQNNKFVMLEGKAHVSDIERLKDLDLEEFE